MGRKLHAGRVFYPPIFTLSDIPQLDHYAHILLFFNPLNRVISSVIPSFFRPPSGRSFPDFRDSRAIDTKKHHRRARHAFEMRTNQPDSHDVDKEKEETSLMNLRLRFNTYYIM